MELDQLNLTGDLVQATPTGLIVIVGDRLKILRETLNRWLPYEPILLIGGTAVLVHGIHYVLQRVPKDGAIAGVKRTFFRGVKRIPYVRRKIDKEIQKTEKSMGEDVCHLYRGDKDDFTFIKDIPSIGLNSEGVLLKVAEYLKLGSYNWNNGSVSGTVYHGGKELTDLNAKVYEMSTWTNPLHPDVFPGICKMESEIVRIVANLFHGGPNACGSVTSGGTESIILSVKAYRDCGVEEKGILHPEILIPVTAHAAFTKAALLLNIGIKHVPINPETCTVDVKAMRRMITKNTVMIVGSTPAFPHGCIDDIQAIAALGVKYNIPVHVDACLGGFLLAFMPKAGYPVAPFDFSVPGVTSISADTHKYGFAPKGSSCLIFSEKKYKHYQYFLQSDWPGGLYASPTIAGSRPGALIAGCWATMLYFGLSGYVETTRKIVYTTRYLEEKLRKIPGIYVMGKPQTSVVALASNEFDIYRLQDALNKIGWSMNALQFPASIHFCVTYCQTEPGVADRFIKAVTELVEEIMKTKDAPSSGAAAAIYGSSQKVTDRSIVHEITALYLDALYETNYPISFTSSAVKSDDKNSNGMVQNGQDKQQKQKNKK